MNARFRIGTTYVFENRTHEAFIVEKPITYLGYNKDTKKFLFQNLHGIWNPTQSCPKKWLDKNLVSVETEWKKKRKA